MKNFGGHLHTHTEYSVLDGMSSIKELLETAKELGQEFIAITDHGSMSGLWEAQKLSDEIGIKVILGCEFYYQRENDDGNGHLIVLAKDNVGLSNMYKLQEYAYVENFNRRARITFDKLVEYKEGLIITSACLASTLNQYLIEGEYAKAKQWAEKFKEEFGEDFYIEIQPNNIPEQLIVNKSAIRLAKELNIKTIATNDVHYTFKEDYFPHEILLAMQTNQKISSEKRFKFDTEDFWLKSEEEMYQNFHGIDKEDITSALKSTFEIANKCNARIEKGKYLPPYYNIPEGETERSLLVKKTIEGARKKGFITNKEYMKEVQKEIDIIDRNGYSGYFLIVQDYVNTARKNGIVVGDGRGSGVASKVGYLIDITRVEPNEHNLLFERFMADGRSPDYDVDFSNQEAVFNDLQEKYGEGNIARIVAFGTLQPKAVLRKVFSTFEYSQAEINQIARLIPPDAKSIKQLLESNTELSSLYSKYKTEFDVIVRIEGKISHESQHAGGAIIYPNLTHHLPVKTKAEDRTRRIVGFDKNMLEELGFYKMDILGLETLPIIKTCTDSIKETTGKEIDLYNIDYTDEGVYKMLSSGDVSGVFQLNNQAQKVMQQEPNKFDDLIAINALIRPGVGNWQEYLDRRKGKSWYVHPNRMNYMKDTVGIITYQEQYLLDCKILAGWEVAFSDAKVRKNKTIRQDEELKEKFVKDSLANGYDEVLIYDVWQEIVDAVDGGYSFNKAHATSYAVLSYQTAWLKYHYPEHFYAALMSHTKTDSDGQMEIAGYISECKEKGIKILPPDINISDEVFKVTEEGIQYRITAITHVGDSAIKGIKEIRPIKSFEDFIERRQKSTVRQNVIINLIKAGCFDFDNINRAELLWKFDMSNRTNKQVSENFTCEKYEWNDKIKSEWEKQVLGTYLSSHPMERYGFKPMSEFREGEVCLQGGDIYNVAQVIDRNGNEMAFVGVETLFGNLKVVVFNRQWNENNKEILQEGNRVMIKGRKSGNSILLNEAELLE